MRITYAIVGVNDDPEQIELSADYPRVEVQRADEDRVELSCWGNEGSMETIALSLDHANELIEALKRAVSDPH